MSNQKADSERLRQAIADIQEEDALALTKQMLAEGVDPLEILEQAKKGTEIVGERFNQKEYFLSELMMAGEIMKSLTELVKPFLSQTPQKEPLGKMVIGTVKGDVHDIGKNMVIFLHDVAGFEVHDLGIDVPPERFVQAIEDVKPDIVGMSGLLTISYESMKSTVDAIISAGLRDKVHIIIGGALVTEQVREYVGADAYRPDPASAVIVSREWVGR